MDFSNIEGACWDSTRPTPFWIGRESHLTHSVYWPIGVICYQSHHDDINASRQDDMTEFHAIVTMHSVMSINTRLIAILLDHAKLPSIHPTPQVISRCSADAEHERKLSAATVRKARSLNQQKNESE